MLTFVYANRGYVMDLYLVKKLGVDAADAAKSLCRLGFLVEESGVYAIPEDDEE